MSTTTQPSGSSREAISTTTGRTLWDFLSVAVNVIGVPLIVIGALAFGIYRFYELYDKKQKEVDDAKAKAVTAAQEQLDKARVNLVQVYESQVSRMSTFVKQADELSDFVLANQVRARQGESNLNWLQLQIQQVSERSREAEDTLAKARQETEKRRQEMAETDARLNDVKRQLDDFSKGLSDSARESLKYRDRLRDLCQLILSSEDEQMLKAEVQSTLATLPLDKPHELLARFAQEPDTTNAVRLRGMIGIKRVELETAIQSLTNYAFWVALAIEGTGTNYFGVQRHTGLVYSNVVSIFSEQGQVVRVAVADFVASVATRFSSLSWRSNYFGTNAYRVSRNLLSGEVDCAEVFAPITDAGLVPQTAFVDDAKLVFSHGHLVAIPVISASNFVSLFQNWYDTNQSAALSPIQTGLELEEAAAMFSGARLVQGKLPDLPPALKESLTNLLDAAVRRDFHTLKDIALSHIGDRTLAQMGLDALQPGFELVDSRTLIVTNSPNMAAQIGQLPRGNVLPAELRTALPPDTAAAYEIATRYKSSRGPRRINGAKLIFCWRTTEPDWFLAAYFDEAAFARMSTAY